MDLNFLKSIFKFGLYNIVFLIGIAAFFVGLFCLRFTVMEGTYLSFQSSDGKWTDAEFPSKGHDFHAVVFDFELYKMNCQVPEVTLQRTTKRPAWYEPESWFNDYSDPKWLVPYADPTTNSASSADSSPAPEDCKNKGFKLSEIHELDGRVTALINTLKESRRE